MPSAVDPRFGAELRRLREQTGTSQQHLAAAAGTVKSHVSDIERGQRRPSPAMARAFDYALNAGGTLTALVAVDHPLTDDDDDRLAYITTKPRSVDAATLDALAQSLAAQRRLDDLLGSAAVVGSAQHTLTVVTRIVEEATGPLRERAVDVAAQWSQFLGWLHTTGARWAEATAALRQAIEWGQEAGSPDMVATALSYEGHVAWLTGRPAPVVSKSRAARRDTTVYVGQRAYDAYQEARGLAVIGQTGDALSVLAEADDLAAANTEWAGEVPAWQYYRAPWFFSLERGLVYRHLAHAQPELAGRAVDELAAGVAGLPQEWLQAEWAAEYMTHLAGAHLLAGHVDEARQVAARARTVATTTASARVTAMVERVERRLP